MIEKKRIILFFLIATPLANIIASLSTWFIKKYILHYTGMFGVPTPIFSKMVEDMFTSPAFWILGYVWGALWCGIFIPLLTSFENKNYSLYTFYGLLPFLAAIPLASSKMTEERLPIESALLLTWLFVCFFLSRITASQLKQFLIIVTMVSASFLYLGTQFKYLAFLHMTPFGLSIAGVTWTYLLLEKRFRR